jgi:hypothetical protein
MRIRKAKALAWVGLLAGLAAGRPLAADVSVEQNPAVEFATPGEHRVTLTACHDSVCSSSTQTVTVLDPRPQITGISVGPTLLQPAGAVSLAATADGKPPLVYSWRVVDPLGVTVVTLPGADASWAAEASPLGAYAIFLDVGNDAGTTTSDAIAVELAALVFADGFELGDTVAWTPQAPP